MPRLRRVGIQRSAEGQNTNRKANRPASRPDMRVPVAESFSEIQKLNKEALIQLAKRS